MIGSRGESWAALTNNSFARSRLPVAAVITTASLRILGLLGLWRTCSSISLVFSGDGFPLSKPGSLLGVKIGAFGICTIGPDGLNAFEGEGRKVKLTAQMTINPIHT